MAALDTFLNQVPVEQRALVRRIDAVVTRAAPGLEASLKWGNLTYHARHNVCAIVSHERHVNLQFWLGARLEDPRSLLTGTGKQMRHLACVPDVPFDGRYVAGLVRQAVRLDAA